ncbi:hypothetical protein F2P79_004974 [Pimephales promelas]|nr:hypothetical protein F2P79_004974 [Pimephales promelas]
MGWCCAAPPQVSQLFQPLSDSTWNLTSLKALSLRICPLSFPPRDVLDQPKILHHLRCAQLGEVRSDRRWFSSLTSFSSFSGDVTANGPAVTRRWS